MRLLAALLLAVPTVAVAAPGDLDPSFGVGGRATVDFGSPSGVNEARAVVLQPDGKIVAAGSGTTTAGAAPEAAVARLTADGILDGSFGSGGKVVLTFGPDDIGGAATGVARQSDGKIVVAGTVIFNGAWPSIVLARLDAGGILDGAFGTGGKVVLDLGMESRANSLALQPDGKILVAGCAMRTHGADTYCDMLVARFDGNGVPDAGFGINGVAFADFGAGFDSEAFALLRLPDGRLLAGGSTSDVASLGNGDFAFARFLPDGRPDNTTFGPPRGTVSVSPLGTSHIGAARALVLLPDNTFVAAGWVEDTTVGGIQAALVRIDAGGAIVPSFGTVGVRLLDFNGSFAYAYALLRQPDGKLVAAGKVTISGEEFAFARLDASGVLDSTFGAGGIVTHDGSLAGGGAFAIAQQLDGKLVPAGKYGFFLGVLRMGNDSAALTPDIAVTDSDPPATDLIVSFGTVTAGTSSDQTVTVTNTGTADLVLGTIAANSLAAPFGIQADACSGTTLAPSWSCLVTVRFAPAAAGPFNDAFDVPSNDPDENPVTVSVTGTGSAGPVPDIEVTDSVPPAGDRVIDFGSVFLGASTDQTVTVRNTGAADLSIGAILHPHPPFSIVSGTDNCSGRILPATPSASCSFTARFEPTNKDSFADDILIPSDDPDENLVAVSLQGETPNRPPTAPVPVSPVGVTVSGAESQVTFVWQPGIDPDGDPVAHSLFICTDSSFSDCDPPISINLATGPPERTFTVPAPSAAGLTLLLAAGFVAGVIGIRRGRGMVVAALLLATAVAMHSCASPSTAPVLGRGQCDGSAARQGQNLTWTVDKNCLAPRATYYWKVLATDQFLSAESAVVSFQTP